MSRSSLPSLPSGARLTNRLRTISTAESDVSCEEAARLTDDGCGGSDQSFEPELPPPPDGGYGWIIVLASFLCNLVVDGIAYTFGIFLPVFVLDFGEGKGKVAWVGSILSGMYLAVGPVVSALCNKFGCRAVCIAGSLMASSAFVLSTFSTSINMMMLVYGVIGGIGFGMIYLPAVVAVGYYFETKRSLATGIAVCGSGVGTFTFAPLANYLLEEFGWRGANLILAGLILNCAVFGALMRPLVYPKNSPNVKPLLQRMAEEKRMQMERGSIAGSFFMVQRQDGTMEKRMKMPLNIDPGVHSSFNLDQLVPTGLTPVPTMATLPTIPTLPTISEAKVQDSESSSNDSGTSDPEKIRTKILESDKQPLEMKIINPAKGIMPRNVSSPAFTTYHQGLPKNGSVPSFDRIRKPSTGERFKPSLAAIKASSRNSMSSNGDIRKNMHLRLSNSSMRNNNSEYDDGDSVYNSKLSISIQRETPRTVKPLARKDIFYSGSVINLPEYQSQKSLTNYRNSVMSLPQSGTQSRRGDVEAPEKYDLCPCLVMSDSFKSALASMMDMSLLKNPVFLMIGISNVFGFLGLYVPFFYLIDAAKESGIDQTKASFLLSVIGLTNTIGRIICGWIADFPGVNSLLLNNICLVISTISVTLTPLCSSYASYVTMAIFFGIAISGYISLTSIILVDLLGLDKLTNAFGLLILFRGGAALVGSPLAGTVYDATNSLSTSFVMAGIFFGIATVTSFAVPFMKRCSEPEMSMQNPEALTPIDEDDEYMDDEDPDDSPITMGKHPSNGGNVPQIIHTAASPMNPEPPSKPGDVVYTDRNGKEGNGINEIKQIESVL